MHSASGSAGFGYETLIRPLSLKSVEDQDDQRPECNQRSEFAR